MPTFQIRSVKSRSYGSRSSRSQGGLHFLLASFWRAFRPLIDSAFHVLEPVGFLVPFSTYRYVWMGGLIGNGRCTFLGGKRNSNIQHTNKVRPRPCVISPVSWAVGCLSYAEKRSGTGYPQHRLLSFTRHESRFFPSIYPV